MNLLKQSIGSVLGFVVGLALVMGFRSCVGYKRAWSPQEAQEQEQRREAAREGEPPVVLVEESDPEMVAAIEKAKSTLDGFIQHLKSPGSREFSIKAAFETDDGSVEHIWISDVSYADGYFNGNLANEPVGLGKLKLGDPVRVPRADVSDWIILDGEKMSGGFTSEVLMKRNPQP